MAQPSRSQRSSKAPATRVGAESSGTKEVRFNVSVLPSQFPLLFFANRIGLELISGNPLVHFGTASDSVGMLAQFAVILDPEMIRHNWTDWSDFIGRNPVDSTQMPDFAFRCLPNTLKSVPVASVAMWALLPHHGELRLFSVSMGETAEAYKQQKDSTLSQPIALIRMPAGLQYHLLSTLLSRHDTKG